MWLCTTCAATIARATIARRITATTMTSSTHGGFPRCTRRRQGPEHGGIGGGVGPFRRCRDRQPNAGSSLTISVISSIDVASASSRRRTWYSPERAVPAPPHGRAGHRSGCDPRRSPTTCCERGPEGEVGSPEPSPVSSSGTGRGGRRLGPGRSEGGPSRCGGCRPSANSWGSPDRKTQRSTDPERLPAATVRCRAGRRVHRLRPEPGGRDGDSGGSDRLRRAVVRRDRARSRSSPWRSPQSTPNGSNSVPASRSPSPATR